MALYAAYGSNLDPAQMHERCPHSPVAGTGWVEGWRLTFGGEDLGSYVGAPRLIRATGTEPFDTVADGVSAVEHPEPGEVVWCDDAGVTCRRWNWRQGPRTGLTPRTTSALFVLDALDPLTDAGLHAAADELVAHLARLGPDVRVARRLVR